MEVDGKIVHLCISDIGSDQLKPKNAVAHLQNVASVAPQPAMHEYVKIK
jgi:hypothetical protein